MSNATTQGHDDPATADSLEAVIRCFAALRYRKRWLIATVAAAALVGVVYYLAVPRSYEAGASLLVTQSNEALDTATTGDLNGEKFLPTYERLFVSDVVLEGALAELEKMPAEVRVDFVSLPKEEHIPHLRETLTARAVRRTSIIEIRYRSRKPQAAEAVVAAVVRSYLDFMEKAHTDVVVEIVALLDRQRGEIEARMLEKQRELLELKGRIADLGLREESAMAHPAVQRVMRLNDALIEVQEQRLRMEAAQAAIGAALRDGTNLRQRLLAIQPIVGRELILGALGLDPQAIDAMTTVVRQLMDDRARLNALLAGRGPEDPEVQELRQAIELAERYVADSNLRANEQLDDTSHEKLAGDLAEIVEQRLAATKAFEDELAKRYATLEAEAVQLNNRIFELALVESEVARLRQTHDALLARIENMDMRRNRVRVAVVEEPKAAESPVAPRLPLVAALCLLAGLVSGAMIVYVADVRDDRFRSVQELKDRIGAPVLATVRRLPESQVTGPALQVHAAPAAVESKAFRTLRTALAVSAGQAASIAVISAEPGDGKTTVLANLAVACAQAGRKTLLIDANLRHPELTRLLGMGRSTGLSALLASGEEIALACGGQVQVTGIENLHLLPAGQCPPVTADLLVGPRMGEVVRWAEGAYEQVLIDCPPAFAAGDAGIIGRLVVASLLVVRPARNSRRGVLDAVDRLLAMNVRLGGVVINCTGAEGENGYLGWEDDSGYGAQPRWPANSDGDQEMTDQAPADAGRVRGRAA
jgi:succinoglycan biosynthesis transport protein ExoP